MAGNYQSKVFFEQKDSEEKGETTVLQDRTHPSQKKFFALLGTQICMPLSYYHCNVGLEVRPICDVGPESRPISFLYPILIVPHLILTPWSFSPSVRRSVPLQEGPRGVQHRARRLHCRPGPAAAASPGPGAAPTGAGSGGSAGAATPGRLPAPDASDDEGGATLIAPGGPAGGGGDHVPSPTLDLLTTPPDGGPGRGG